MTCAVIIVAAGRGYRAGPGLPKQWRALSGKPVARWTLERMAPYGPIVMVVHPDDMDRAKSVAKGLDVTLVHGGASRDASVRAGLAALAATPPDLVLIHDVARCPVPHGLVRSVLDALRDYEGAAPALALSDALWTGQDGMVTGTRERAGIYRAQTPQGFHFDAIWRAHQAHPGGAADDVEVARIAGMQIAITPGAEENLKITLERDFSRAQKLLELDMDIRVGNGFDVHALAPGDHVTLCGLRIAHERGLSGHSDADVGMHAITDALYGALGQGDIGQHFPPSDPQWKGAASEIFLCHARDLVARQGFVISNVDCTLICERPKIGPHAAEMIAQIARILEIDPSRVSIKATTSERLGFTGREEGIAAMATAALVRT